MLRALLCDPLVIKLTKEKKAVKECFIVGPTRNSLCRIMVAFDREVVEAMAYACMRSKVFECGRKSRAAF